MFAPDRDQRPFLRIIVEHDERGFPTVRRRQSVGKLTEEVVFPRGDHADMGIVAADQAGLVGVGSKLGVQLQSQLERRADVVAVEHAVLRRLHFGKIDVPPLKIGEFVVR